MGLIPFSKKKKKLSLKLGTIECIVEQMLKCWVAWRIIISLVTPDEDNDHGDDNEDGDDDYPGADGDYNDDDDDDDDDDDCKNCDEDDDWLWGWNWLRT